MKLKRWLLLFVGVCLLCTAAFAGFNALVDPFGVFGDPLLDWYGYDMTMNPRVAKVAYLEKCHENYDSYVIGSSKVSSIPVDELNEYTGASFYNMTWYGGGLWDEQRMIWYLLDNYEVKNIVLALDPSIAVEYRDGTDDLKQQMHCKVDGTSALKFYGSYLFCNPTYALDKLSAYLDRGFLQSPDSVYLPETGVYNKQRRDASPINDLDSYLDYEPGPFTDKVGTVALPYIQESVDAIRDIKNRCDAAGVNLTVIWSPLSDEELGSYRREEVEELLVGVAQVTDSWNFLGLGSVQCDPRYYYDNHHFRNCVGTMMLARIFGNGEVYVPEDFGVYDTAETMAARLDDIFTPQEAEDYVTQVPILMYHAFSETREGVTASTFVSAGAFEEQLLALRDAGYETVTFAQLIDYVYSGGDLPEKPVVIIADDGYANNLTIAAPLLEKYGFSASIAAIGCSVGKDTYKDTDTPIYPHFSLEEAQPWVDSGVIEIISHSYDMHQSASLDGEDCRQGVLPLAGESEEDYIAALTADFLRSKEQLESGLGVEITAFAYPGGHYCETAEIVLHDLGVQVTLTIHPGTNDVIRGIPQSLYQLRRNWITDDMSGQDLIDLLRSFETEE